MKKLLGSVVLVLLLIGTAYAKIDWKKSDLCENSKYKKLCSKIINKKLVGINTIANFKFDNDLVQVFMSVLICG